MTSRVQHAPNEDQVAALIVTYFPDASLPERLNKLLKQVSRVAIIDNGSDDEFLSPLTPHLADGRVTLHRNGANLGIAAALNRGMNLLEDEGYGWVVTLDQDSTVGPGFVPALWATLMKAPAPDDVAMVGANRRDPASLGTSHRWLRPKKAFPFFERVGCECLGSQGATIVITSGTLTNVTIFRQIGPFWEDLFIDLVDIEYCLRARRAGYRTLVSCTAELIHRVGTKRPVSLLGVTLSSTHHVPVRRYYLFRNSIALLKAYGSIYPHWLIYHLMALAEVVVGIILIERRKLAQLRACSLGLWDGLRGRAGPAPARF